MINKDGTIVFGLGTVIVSNLHDTILFQHVQPKQVIGESPTSDYDIIETIIIKYLNDFLEFKKKLRKVTEENNTFKFRCYSFDFSTYNPTSVKVVLAAINRVERNVMMILCA